MPYANVWSTTIPPGTLPANQIDTAIQQTRLDISQRCDTMIGAAGSFATDPVIDGSTAKSLTVLTAELATKTTLSGLTAGVIIQATGVGSVGNASVTNAQLAAMYAAYAAPVSFSDIESTTNATKWALTGYAAGWYLITFTGLASSVLDFAKITGTSFSQEHIVELYGTAYGFTLTAVVRIDVIADITTLAIDSNIGGSYYVTMVKVG